MRTDDMPDFCALIGSFMGQPQYCGEPAESAWHKPGEWFKHEYVPLTLTPARGAAPLDVERLARAMESAANTVYYGTDDPVDWEDEAANIAAEYARLSEGPIPPQPGEPDPRAR